MVAQVHMQKEFTHRGESETPDLWSRHKLAFENYQIVNGIQVKVVSKPAGALLNAAYVDTAGGNPTALGGANRGLEFFDAGGKAAGQARRRGLVPRW